MDCNTSQSHQPTHLLGFAHTPGTQPSSGANESERESAADGTNSLRSRAFMPYKMENTLEEEPQEQGYEEHIQEQDGSDTETEVAQESAEASSVTPNGKIDTAVDRHQEPSTAGVQQIQLLVETCMLIQDKQDIDDIVYWKRVTESFYEPFAKIRTRLWCPDTVISYEFIARYLRASFKLNQMKTNLFLGDVDETVYPNGEIIMDSKKLTVILQDYGEQKYVVKGQLKMHFSPQLKIIFADYSISYCLEKKTPGPEEHIPPPSALINEYGVTNELMRYLEMAEVFSSLGDIMSITKLMNISPTEGLSRMANAITSYQGTPSSDALPYSGQEPVSYHPQSVPIEAQTPHDDGHQPTPTDMVFNQEALVLLTGDSKRGPDQAKTDDPHYMKRPRV